jgi:acetyl esterase/lipase
VPGSKISEHESVTTQNIEVRRDRIYGVHKDGSLLADIYLPKTSKSQTLHPAVITIHGGGWTRGSRHDMASVAMRLAKSGFVAINISYRLAPHHKFPAQVDDVREAVRWTKRESAQLRVDPQRVALFGYSAGAHLALMTALPTGPLAPNSELQPEVSDPDAVDFDSSVQAIVAGGAPVNLYEFESSDLVLDFLGAGREEAPDLWLRASPITHVRRGAPPMFIYHGKNDWVVPVSQSRMLINSLRSMGNHAEYMEVELGHVVTFLFDEDVVKAAIRFLQDRLIDQPLQP